MICTFQEFKSKYSVLRWFKGSGSIQVYAYKRSTNTGKAYNDLTGRCEGRLEGNVHKLNISLTSVGDDDRYTCRVDTQQGSARLTVNGEY